MERIKEVAREQLYFFSYSDHPAGANDPNTTFFTYDKRVKHDYKMLAESFGGYKRCNALALARTANIQADAPRPSFAFNESFPVKISMPKLGGPISPDLLTINIPERDKPKE